jgi:hypothetical protein
MFDTVSPAADNNLLRVTVAIIRVAANQVPQKRNTARFYFSFSQ